MSTIETKIEKQAVTQLVEHELALKVYLDSLLFEELPLQEEVVAAPLLRVVTTPPEVEVKTPEPQLTVAEAMTVAVPPQAQPPEWSEGTFESLLFKVGGFLTLSVPLARLNGIVPWPDKLTAVPGYAEWFLGLLPNRGRQVKIIDIAKFVIPASHKARSTLERGERQFKHIILIDDGQFGLACDELGTVLKLSQGQVRWRHDRTTRPWLAGTVIEQMCAMIDIEQFVLMLKDGVPRDDIGEEP
jgi:purine-binding chemotaxis protein CheW